MNSEVTTTPYVAEETTSTATTREQNIELLHDLLAGIRNADVAALQRMSRELTVVLSLASAEKNLKHTRSVQRLRKLTVAIDNVFPEARTFATEKLQRKVVRTSHWLAKKARKRRIASTPESDSHE